MFKIKKHLFILPALFLSVFMSFFTSCDQLHLEDMSKGSVVFNFNSDFFSKIDKKQVSHSRAAFEEYFSYGHYIDVSLEGDFNYSATINLSSQTYISIDDIPVGARITATLTLYTWPDINDENSKTTLFTGQSEKTTIKAGSNVIKINIAENQYRIYVSCDSSIGTTPLKNKDDLNSLETGTGTKDNPFKYIQSAIYYIAENGSYQNDYEIYLTGYTTDSCFDQQVEFGDVADDSDILQNKATSITITSTDPTITAIKSTQNSTFWLATNTTIKFRNIQIEINNEAYDTNAISVFRGTGSSSFRVYLEYGTVIDGENSGNPNYGGLAKIDRNSSLTMTSNSIIKNFKSHYSGGAVYVADSGCFTMEGKSKIENCTSQEGGGVSVDGSGCFYMIGNSLISGCSSTSNGGAVYINTTQVSQALYMFDDATITKCSATYNGGAVYINAGYFNMSGGKITGNTAPSSGNGVYLPTYNSKLSLSGKAFLSPDDDIYLSYSAPAYYPKITIGGELKNSPAAYLSLPPGYATDGSKLLEDSTFNSSNYNKIAFNPSNAYGETEERYWFLSNTGYLQAFTNIAEAIDKPNIGDIILSDGRRVLSEYADMVPYSLKKRVAGVIFYAGNETDLLGNTNLMVGKEWYHDYFDLNHNYSSSLDQTTKLSNYHAPDSVGDNTGDSPGQLSNIEFSQVNCGYNYLTSAIISNNIDDNPKSPLIKKILEYGKNFDETSSYYLDTTSPSNNWYIPTIAELWCLNEALKLESFKKSYNAICGEIPNSTLWSATRAGDYYSLGFIYRFTCNLKTDEISYELSGNAHYAIPVHRY